MGPPRVAACEARASCPRDTAKIIEERTSNIVMLPDVLLRLGCKPDVFAQRRLRDGARRAQGQSSSLNGRMIAAAMRGALRNGWHGGMPASLVPVSAREA